MQGDNKSQTNFENRENELLNLIDLCIDR